MVFGEYPELYPDELKNDKNSTINSTINVNDIDNIINKIKRNYPELRSIYTDLIKIIL